MDLLVKHNQIIRASYRLSPIEQSIILFTLTKLNRDITDDSLYELDVQEIANLSGLSKSNVARDLKSACERLYERSLTITNEVTDTFRWVQRIRYDKSNSKVSIQFSNPILPYLTKLKDNFTAYNLHHVAKFKSTYGVRVYELIKQWSNTKSEIEISIDELKVMFQLEGKYHRTDVLKTKVLDPALKDINTHSDLKASYSNMKSGRKITGFKFSWSVKKSKKEYLNDEYIQQHARAGESWQEARARIKSELS